LTAIRAPGWIAGNEHFKRELKEIHRGVLKLSMALMPARLQNAPRLLNDGQPGSWPNQVDSREQSRGLVNLLVERDYGVQGMPQFTKS
jgi:hypothetical protein